jgi:hypothetical protein
MIRVRTYLFPGFFYEANPESSTRNIRTIQLHVESDSPPVTEMIAVSGQESDGLLAPRGACLNSA